MTTPPAPQHAPAPSSLAELRQRPGAILLHVVSGSHAYGLATTGSDRDERGVFVLPFAAYATLTAPVEHLQDERGDVAFTGLRKFLALASAANPTALELLFAPADTVLARARCAEPLLAARQMFVTKRCYDSHVGYARAQIRRARGVNKWINNPWPEAPPQREQFCFVIDGPWPGQAGVGTGVGISAPLRPRPLADSGIDLRQCHAAALERVPRAFRLYHYGESARGVFRDGNLVCESIPVEDEHVRLIGLLVYDHEGFEKAKADHHSFWQWRRTRNDARWRTQEAGEIDYDAKNMMHTFRLLLSAAAIHRDGAPRVRFDGADREFLLEVKRGRFAYDELLDRADRLVDELAAMQNDSSLPAAPDEAAVDALMHEVTAAWEADHA
jgi:uncharacterized protein